jgi:hypothetical protein
MTDERLSEIKGVLHASHHESWWELVRHDNPGGEINWQVWVHCSPYGHGFNTSDLSAPGVREDATLVANAPSFIAELLTEVERLRKS